MVSLMVITMTTLLFNDQGTNNSRITVQWKLKCTLLCYLNVKHDCKTGYMEYQ